LSVMLLFKILSYWVFNDALYRNLFFVLFYESKKYFHHSTSSFIFVHKQMSSAIVCLDWPITV